MLKAVLDIGKTHIKLLLIKSDKVCASYSCKNAPIVGIYPQADTESIWRWLAETLQSCALTPDIDAIVVTTHGATAALINENATGDNKLVLPVLDYEFVGIESCNDAYNKIRPAFTETLSPALPAGLNLGKQLYWLQHNYPAEFTSATAILLYPQYWAWRLGGSLATEVTSLGCHTDMWQPLNRQYSSLVDACQWRGVLPKTRNAWDCLGCIAPDIAALTGLSTSCKIYTGIHDSNASLLRYLTRAKNAESFNVISTGTWTILMQANGDTESLSQYKDTLANVDIYNNAVSCARFMGGREYEAICTSLGGNILMSSDDEEIQQALDESWMVTPDFSHGNGPFGGNKSIRLCPSAPPSPQAIATLYCALMIDQRLSDLHSTGTIYIEGAFLKNPALCKLIAQLRTTQKVMLSRDNTGTVMGASSLIAFDKDQIVHLNLVECEPSRFNGLEDYRTKWYSSIRQIHHNQS